MKIEQKKSGPSADLVNTRKKSEDKKSTMATPKNKSGKTVGGLNKELESEELASHIDSVQAGENKESASDSRLDMKSVKNDSHFLNQIKKRKEELKKVPESDKDYSSLDHPKEYAPLDMSAYDDEFALKHNLVPREQRVFPKPNFLFGGAPLPKVLK